MMRNVVVEKTLVQLNCPESDFMNLERLHYETAARERVLSLTLSNESANLRGLFQDYYDEYVKILKEYDTAKQNFYTTYLSVIDEIDKCSTWEVNFTTRSVIFYGV